MIVSYAILNKTDRQTKSPFLASFHHNESLILLRAYHTPTVMFSIYFSRLSGYTGTNKYIVSDLCYNGLLCFVSTLYHSCFNSFFMYCGTESESQINTRRILNTMLVSQPQVPSMRGDANGTRMPGDVYNFQNLQHIFGLNIKGEQEQQREREVSKTKNNTK